MSALVNREMHAVIWLCMSAMENMTSLLGRPLGIRLLSEWLHVVSYIKVHIPPSQLHLSLVCDVEDLQIAEALVKPLLDGGLPPLTSCDVRLGRDDNFALRDRARKAVTHTMGQSRQDEDKFDQKPFRFLDFPLELQYQIFEHTDLVSPRREVTWNPDDGFYLHYDRLWCEEENGSCPPEIHASCRRRNCYMLLDNGCFCHRYHAAFSSACNCWCPPIPLFLISHTLYARAQHVFFSKNCFIVMPSDTYEASKSIPHRFEASIFLRDVVPSNMPHLLRFLEIVIPLQT